MRVYDAIQNSMKGTFILQQNFNKGNLSIQVVPVLNPKKPNEIQKGDKIYDYDNSEWFALSEDECNQLLLFISRKKTKGFEGDKQKDEESIEHFREDAKTILTLGMNQNNGFYLSFSKISNKRNVFNLYLTFGANKLLTFENFLKSISMVKTLSAFFDYWSWKTNSTSTQKKRVDSQSAGSTITLKTEDSGQTFTNPFEGANDPLGFVD